jgi:pyrroloquinoline quinone (PQQ) biosynthesis protein C
MPPHTLDAAFDQAISGRRLLEHAYYRRWQDGRLTLDDLGAYAEQYRHVERCLPDVLATAAQQLNDGIARQRIEENLEDELTRPRPHIELFDAFADAVGAGQEVATTATHDLVARYQEASSDPVAALSVIGAYEVQAAQVAQTKADSLRRHYGLSARDTEFWDVHADLEQTHSAWTVEALRELGASPAKVLQFAMASAKAWWAFLDERELMASYG